MSAFTLAPAARAAACARAAAPAPGARRSSLAVQQQVAAAQQLRRRGVCRAAAPEAEASSPEPAQAPPAAAADGAQTAKDAEPSKPKLVSAQWQEVIDWQKGNEVIETTVKGANKSGLNVQVGKLNGFLPYKLVDASRLPQRRTDGGLAPPPAKGYQELVGQKIRVRITQVIVPEKRLIVSEKAVLLAELAAMVRPGDLVEGAVGGIMDFGAFIECHSINGKPCPRAEVVLPMREISYAWVASAHEVLTPGQPVKVVVVFSQTQPTAKVVVSLKRLEDDPLKETLDKVLPLNEQGDSALDSVPAAVPSGMEEILQALSSQPGVEAVTLGRTVEEKRTVSQDLELWITKEEVEHGFNLAVRAGRLVQEVKVATGMSADDMRATVQRVLRSIN